MTSPGHGLHGASVVAQRGRHHVHHIGRLDQRLHGTQGRNAELGLDRCAFRRVRVMEAHNKEVVHGQRLLKVDATQVAGPKDPDAQAIC